MGNQLAGIAPSQIFPVEHYLADIPDFHFVSSLGSTRFFKVVKAQSKEGLVVVKVFAIHDPTLPLQIYRNQLDVCRVRLAQSPNCLPFIRSILTDKAGILIRQYDKYNLYDRISTRPFLSVLERKWITFQVLCALNQCHSAGICHGDVKLENIMVTSWNWIMLTDFASFKPTYLPEDNPADFSYYFDTSRRRTCYIAPERFVRSFSSDSSDAASGNTVLPNEEFHKGDLTPKMDIFSAGCALVELFTEGHSPFDFSQLLSYRNEEYCPSKSTDKIEDLYIRELVLHMMQRDPNKRYSADKYLELMRGNAFPEYFYTFLFSYMRNFVGRPIMSPDEKIEKIQRDLDVILLSLGANKPGEMISGKKAVDGLIFIISLVASCLRSIKRCSGKLKALQIINHLAPYIGDEFILDRLLPYLLYCTTDVFSQVKMLALEVLTNCLALVEAVPRSDANIFPEYILPSLTALASDDVVMVRVTVAKNIASLAETALRFLELSQLENPNLDTNEEIHIQYQASYDSDLQTLQELIQRSVSILLTNSDNIVKRTLLEFGINRLCVFFGRQKANDVLLSHMITVLNDKDDQHLRGAFFDSVVGVASYIGWQSSLILKPLLQQGLSDSEEFVTSKTLNTISCLAELGLFHQYILYDFIKEIVPFCCHPNMWIRNNAVGFICTVAKTLNLADVHCKLLPVLEPFLDHPVFQIENKVIVLGSLKEPIPRSIFDTVIRTPVIGQLMEFLQERKNMRRMLGHTSHDLGNPERLSQQLKIAFRRLTSDGLTEATEIKILAMADYLTKFHKARIRHQSDQIESDGKVDLKNVIRRATPYVYQSSLNDDYTLHSSMYNKQMAESPSRIGMNEEWQHMFGSCETRSPSPMINKDPDQMSILSPPTESAANVFATESLSNQFSTGQETTSTETEMSNIGNILSHQVSVESPSTSNAFKKNLSLNYVYCFEADDPSACQKEFDKLLQHKSEQHMTKFYAKHPSQNYSSDSKQPPSHWRPKGILVAHLQEHKAAVNRLAVIPGTPYLASCSSDGTVKIWDCERMERRSITNRSRQTYSRPDNQIFSMTVCQNLQSIACGSDNGSIHVFKIETSSTKMTTTFSRMLDLQEEGYAVDMNYFDAGSQSVLIYATMYGAIVGWDLRAPGTAWKLENDPKQGLLTTFTVDQQQCWLAVGTSSGAHVCWDLRFHLPISTVIHPIGSCVRRLLKHPYQQSCVVSAVQGNNEVSVWDMETEARRLTLWGSPNPPFSHASVTDSQGNHAATGMYILPRDGNPVIITGGTDARIRFWDITYPAKNYIIAGAANEVVDLQSFKYQSQLIDGTEVIKEFYDKTRKVSEDAPRRLNDVPPTGHLDSISDITLYQTSQRLLVSASRDGVVKVWK
ncbi:General transcription factor II-I repeat domain-containing protein 1 [Chamberlinius hualienensis]